VPDDHVLLEADERVALAGERRLRARPSSVSWKLAGEMKVLELLLMEQHRLLGLFFILEFSLYFNIIIFSISFHI
jgi:hypothetical protein